MFCHVYFTTIKKKGKKRKLKNYKRKVSGFLRTLMILKLTGCLSHKP